MRKPKLSVKVSTIETLERACEAPGVEVIPDLEFIPLEKLPPSVDHELLPLLPRFQRDVEIKRALAHLKRRGFDRVLVGNIGSFQLARKDFNVALDFPVNIFNSEAVLLMARAGVKRMALSNELTIKELKPILERAGKLNVHTEILVHGTMELMISRQCLHRNTTQGLSCNSCNREGLVLRDSKGFEFTLRKDLWCNNHIYNSMELSMLGKYEDLKKLVVSKVWLK